MEITANDFDGFSEFLQSEPVIENKRIKTDSVVFTIKERDYEVPNELNSKLIEKNRYYNDLIFGKNPTEKIVSVEVVEDKLHLFLETEKGVEVVKVPHKYWIVSSYPLDGQFLELKGDLHYKYIKLYDKKGYYFAERQKWNYKKDIFTPWDEIEMSLLLKGFTYYKGLTPTQVSILSFDIETTGIVHNENSKLLCISNTFRRNGNYTTKLFSYKDYENEGKMIEAWCDWVREVDPSILVGHNIFNFDLQYIKFIAEKFGVKICLGRDGSNLSFRRKPSDFRVDGNRDQEYYNVKCFGREIVDTYFIAMAYDIGKKYESYGLKALIKAENMEKAGRTHYDGAKIKDNYMIPEEWEKITAYALDDSEDPIKLFDKMIPATFFTANNIPKTFQQICLSATGSKINSILLRSYLQKAHSIPKADKLEEKVIGGISEGIPGKYRNVIKIDLKSAYPSQVLRFKLYEPSKDPEANYYNITKFFAEERFRLKILAKKDPIMKALDDAMKVLINSIYGAANTSGLHFNSSKLANRITYETRKMIEFAVEWATSKDYQLWRQENKLDDENAA